MPSDTDNVATLVVHPVNIMSTSAESSTTDLRRPWRTGITVAKVWGTRCRPVVGYEGLGRGDTPDVPQPFMQAIRDADELFVRAASAPCA